MKKSNLYSGFLIGCLVLFGIAFTAKVSADELVVTTTISPEAQWAGIQKASDANGADLESVANFSFTQPPGAGATKSATVTGPGFYRGWSSDFDYDIHFSAFVEV